MNAISLRRTKILFLLATLGADVILAAIEIISARRMETMVADISAVYLLTGIIGLSIGQMAFTLMDWMREPRRWRLAMVALVVAFFFGLSPCMHAGGVDVNRVLVIQVATLFLGIVPVAIYRAIFVGLPVQFSLAILFAMMTLVTVACVVAIQLEIEFWFVVNYFFFFLVSSLPIPLAGFMLVGPSSPSIRTFAFVVSSLVLFCVAFVAIYQNSLGDIGLVAQVTGFTAFYLLLGGVVLLRERNSPSPTPHSESQPSGEETLTIE